MTPAEIRTEDEQFAFHIKNFATSGYVPCAMCLYNPVSGSCNAPRKREHYYNGECGIFSVIMRKKYGEKEDE